MNFSGGDGEPAGREKETEKGVKECWGQLVRFYIHENPYEQGFMDINLDPNPFLLL